MGTPRIRPRSLRRALMLPVLVLVLALPACGRIGPPPEPVTIVFACERGDVAFYEPLAQRFNQENPRITVQVVGMDSRRLERDLDDAGVDVLTAAFSLRNLINSGALLNLDPWISQDDSFAPDDFYPGLLKLYTYEGKTWAIPSGVDPLVMYYNRDLLERYGAPQPAVSWTWEDMLITALTVRDVEAGVYGYAPTFAMLDAMLFAYQHGGHLVDDWNNPVRTTFDDPLVIEALEWYSRLFLDEGVAPTPEEAMRAFGGRELAGVNGVVQGKVALWTGFYSWRGGTSFWPRKWDFRWGMVPLPRDRESATLMSVEALAIASNTQHPQACWQWLAYLSRAMPGRLAPARRSVAGSGEFERLVGAEIAAAVRASLEHALIIPPDAPEILSRVGQPWQRAIEQIVSGEATAEEALRAAQQQVNP